MKVHDFLVGEPGSGYLLIEGDNSDETPEDLGSVIDNEF